SANSAPSAVRKFARKSSKSLVLDSDRRSPEGFADPLLSHLCALCVLCGEEFHSVLTTTNTIDGTFRVPDLKIHSGRIRDSTGKDSMYRFAGLLGIIVLLSLAYLFSTNRRAIRLKTVLWGLGLQFVFAFIVIYSDVGQRGMKFAGDKVTQLLSYAFAGSE